MITAAFSPEDTQIRCHTGDKVDRENFQTEGQKLSLAVGIVLVENNPGSQRADLNIKVYLT